MGVNGTRESLEASIYLAHLPPSARCVGRKVVFLGTGTLGLDSKRRPPGGRAAAERGFAGHKAYKNLLVYTKLF